MSTELVSNWLQQGIVTCPSEFTDAFYDAKKKDDMSDSLLIGKSFVDWIYLTKTFLDTFTIKIDGKYEKFF
jgi:hypothetical protein